MASLALTVEGFGVRPPGARAPVFEGVGFGLEPGHAALLGGAGGAGKSLFLESLAGRVLGELAGEARLGALSLDERGRWLRRVAFVADEGARGLSGAAFSVFDEVAFGPANLGLPAAAIRRRVGALLERFGLLEQAGRAPWTLSGGETQRLVLASALAMDVALLLLDEPAAQLDARSARALYALLAELKREGRLLLLAIHDLEPAEGLWTPGDRGLLLADGRLRYDGPRDRAYFRAAADSGASLPLHARFDLGLPPPRFDGAALAALIRPLEGLPVVLSGVTAGQPGAPVVLRELSLRLEPGEIAAVVGPNGAGKTTLGKLLNGLLRPISGQVAVGGLNVATRSVAELAFRVGYLFQDPESSLFSRSVRLELAFGPRQLGRRGRVLEAAVARALALAGLEGAAETHPYDLRPAERRWLALGAVLAMETPVLVLDEPSRALAPADRARLLALLRALRAAGRTILLISHDLGLVAEAADRVWLLEAGMLVGGPPREVLLDERALERVGLELPPAVRLARSLGLGPCLHEDELFALRTSQPTSPP